MKKLHFLPFIIPILLVINVGAEVPQNPPNLLQLSKGTINTLAKAKKIKKSSFKKSSPISLPLLKWGAPSAPLVMMEYSAPSCHICGIFAREILPRIQEHYIKTGLLRLEIYCLPYNRLDLKTCLLIYQSPSPHDAYLVLLQNQDKWLDKSKPIYEAEQILKKLDMEMNSIKAAFPNRDMEDALIRQRINIEKNCKIEGLPVFKIGATEIQGLVSWKSFDKIFKAALNHVQQGNHLSTFYEKS